MLMDASSDIRYKYVLPMVTQTVNKVANANWKIIKPALDSTLNNLANDVLKSFFTPIFSHISIQDLIISNDQQKISLIFEIQ